jgi:hypothetical protein
MDLNEGTLDRALRILVGLVLIAFPLGLFGMDHAYVWGWIGLVPLVTGLVGWCPAYSLLRIKTCLAPTQTSR